MYTYSVSPYLAQEVLKSAKALGYLVPEAAAALLDPGSTSQPQLSRQRVPLRNLCRLLRTLETQSGDPAIGLRLGQALGPSAFSLVGHLVLSCQTIGQALKLVTQFQQLVIDCGQADCQAQGDALAFRWTPTCDFDSAQRVLIDLILSATRSFGIWVTGIQEPFSDVFFQYRKPANTKACEDVFGQPGHYGCTFNGFRIPLAWGDQPIRSASESLQPMIEQQAKYELQHMQSQHDYVSHVTDALLRLLPQGHSAIEKVSETLHLTPRTLQRHLQSQGTTFAALLKKTRLEKADEYLKDTRMTLADIALHLGYREQSSFSSAYKSWTGLSPHQRRGERCPEVP